MRFFVVAALLVPPLWLSGCAYRSRALEDPGDSFVVLEPVVGTRIKKRIRRSELNGYVGIAPTRKTIVTEDTDMLTLPTPRM